MVVERVKQVIDSADLERAAERAQDASRTLSRAFTGAARRLNEGKETIEAVRSREVLSTLAKGTLSLGLVGAGFNFGEEIGQIVLETLRGKDVQEQFGEFLESALPGLLSDTLPELLREERRTQELATLSLLEAQRAERDTEERLRSQPFFAREVDASIQAEFESRSALFERLASAQEGDG